MKELTTESQIARDDFSAKTEQSIIARNNTTQALKEINFYKNDPNTDTPAERAVKLKEMHLHYNALKDISRGLSLDAENAYRYYHNIVNPF